MDRDAETYYENPSEPMINRRNGMLMEDWIDGGKNTRFNGSTAAEAGRKGQRALADKRRREQNLQMIIQAYFQLPISNKKETEYIEDIECYDEITDSTNMTVLAKAVKEIVDMTQRPGGSIQALESLIRMGGMMPTTKTDVSLERINEIRFVTKSTREDIDKLYPDIKRMCEKYDMDPGKPEDYEKLKEY